MTTRSIINLKPRVFWYHIHWTVLYTNMVFVIAKPWLAQESNNSTTLVLISHAVSPNHPLYGGRGLTVAVWVSHSITIFETREVNRRNTLLLLYKFNFIPLKYANKLIFLLPLIIHNTWLAAIILYFMLIYFFTVFLRNGTFRANDFDILTARNRERSINQVCTIFRGYNMCFLCQKWWPRWKMAVSYRI